MTFDLNKGTLYPETLCSNLKVKAVSCDPLRRPNNQLPFILLGQKPFNNVKSDVPVCADSREGEFTQPVNVTFVTAPRGYRLPAMTARPTESPATLDASIATLREKK
ncbi:hypothetical protein N7528_008575 [Penicillium herquei]|nr:hypothetical protein N7528_008575 [Penicillium herquei]